jgi:2-methylcitrate dehydratase
LKDDRIFSVIDKFKVIADPEFEKLFPEKQAVHVTVKTTEGKSFELRMDYPKGDPREPMTQEDLDMKFRALASSCMSDKRIEEIKTALFDFDKAARLNEVMALLTADK